MTETASKPIIIRYGEIGVKSPRVRSRFEKRLIFNIKNIVPGDIHIKQGRILLFPENYSEALESLGKIFGVVSYSPTVQTTTDYDSIKETLKNYVKKLVQDEIFSGEQSFAIRCRRVGEHNFTSQEMAAYCGAVVVDETGSPVNLSEPDFTIFVEVRDDKTYIFHEKIKGLGGLPIGTQGRVIALLSGGQDSPVATFLMMKRGCAVTLLHFNNYPFTGESLDKITKIVEKLKEYSSGSKVNFCTVNYGDYMQKIVDEAPPRMACVLCKSGMYQLAEKLAEKEGAMAIIDGSSMGQVASQTLPNILATRYSTNMPILSPLIGLDKVEIQDIGEKIGTLAISILPESGCRAAPKHPETNTVLEKVLETQKKIGMDDELDKIFQTLEKNK